MKLPPLPKPSLLARLSLVLTSGLAIVAGFALASLLFVVLLIAGVAVAGWLWWQYRRLISQARRAAPEIIEGDYTVEAAHPLLEDQRAPTNPATRPRHNGCHE
ncbi:MAG: hypothetical protein EKK68_04255 [Candidatus Competibacteraceae bacterium]|nr:MAG: hypothetical protein EKK68_04255 [Candidatus Competibacteraceae bacterium]